MIPQPQPTASSSSSAASYFSQSHLFCPSCKRFFNPIIHFPFSKRRKKQQLFLVSIFPHHHHHHYQQQQQKTILFSSSSSNSTNFNNKNNNSTNLQSLHLLLPLNSYSSKRPTAKTLDQVDELSLELEQEQEQEQVPIPNSSNNFTNFQEDPIVDKLRTQLGVIHPIPSPPINRSIVGLFVFFFFVGVVFDKLWTSRKRKKDDQRHLGGGGGGSGAWPQVPTSFSLFLEQGLQRKESVEWVNMVLGKLWKVYRGGIENWLIGLLQPVIDNLQKPDYVERVEIKQFSLGDDPLSVRNVERRTSRRVNDLQLLISSSFIHSFIFFSIFNIYDQMLKFNLSLIDMLPRAL